MNQIQLDVMLLLEQKNWPLMINFHGSLPLNRSPCKEDSSKYASGNRKWRETQKSY